jgi:hypothetical protein
MNYKRIYDQFIEDRLNKQPNKPDYFEVHHILPRSLGGSNDPSNLIRLTAEDHLFAHLLLAKIHGGKMWIAVQAMCCLVNENRKKLGKVFGRRRMYGFVRRSLVKYYREVLSGPNGKIADKKSYTLHHHEGRVASGNRFELEEQTGVPRQKISALLRGANKTSNGWYSKVHNPNGLNTSQLLSESIRSNDVLVLHHYDGRIWQGTRKEFSDKFGGKFFLQHPNGSCLGWHKSKEDASKYYDRILGKTSQAANARGDISGSNNPNADTRKYWFVVLATGEKIEATKVELKQRFDIKSSDICALFNGRQKKTKGISLYKSTNESREEYSLV